MPIFDQAYKLHDVPLKILQHCMVLQKMIVQLETTVKIELAAIQLYVISYAYKMTTTATKIAVVLLIMKSVNLKVNQRF